MGNRLRATTALTTIALLFSLSIDRTYANPEGGQVVGGSAQIIESVDKLDVYQQSHRAVIDWRSFNIDVNEHTQFHQPSSNAIALNRINDVNPSRIAGRLTANGNVILVNPNGVFFEGSSRVDVNGIVATTAGIEALDFMNGSNHFGITGHLDAAIINEGVITAKDAGLVGLVAPNVENRGVIQAKLGRVQLASGDTVTVDFYGDDLLQVSVRDEDVKSQIVANTGILSADGGKVAMTAAAARNTVNSLILADGYVEAKSIGQDHNGTIIIGGEGSNKADKTGDSFVVLSGALNASGRNDSEQGGRVDVLGDHILLTETAFIDASGYGAPESSIKTESATLREDKSIDNGVRTEEDFLSQDSRAGGSIKIGGDYLGKGSTQTAKTVQVNHGALIVNDAVEKGDGGRTIIWSDDTTVYEGLVLSRGGINGGHGGFVETSGKNHLSARGYADLTNRHDGYKKGTYLLDPTDIQIYGNVDPRFVSTDNSIDLDTGLTLWLDGNDIDGDGTAEGLLEDGIVSGVGDCGSAINCVTDWVDKSSDGHSVLTQSIAANRPEIEIAAQNGLDVLSFDTDFFELPSSLYSISASDNSLFTVAQSSSSSAQRIINGVVGSGSRWGIFYNRSSGNFEFINNTSFSPVTVAGSLNTASFIGFTRDGSTIQPYVNGVAQTSGTASAPTLTDLVIGRYPVSGTDSFDGRVMEVLAYADGLSSDEVDLLEQYQAIKWGLALTPPGTGATEVERATASDGYSVFTVDYLEHLSASADIALVADNSITLDLQGETFALDSNRHLSLTTTNGDITDTSVGTILTDNGNIRIDAGGAGNIDLDTTNLEATNGGLVYLSAGGSVNVTQDTSLELGLVTANDVRLESVLGSITGQGGIVTNGGNIDVVAAGDINFSSFGLRSNNGNITVDAGEDIILTTSTNSGTGAVNVTAGHNITIQQHDISTSLINHWAFDENTGTSVNDDVNGVTGNFVGNAAFDSDNPFGITDYYSVSFDGTDDQIDFGDYDDIELNDITFSFWVQSDDISRDQGFLYKGDHSTSNPLLIWRDDSAGGGSSQGGNTDALSVLVYDGSTQDWISTPSGSFNTTDWRHVTVTLNPSSNLMNIYLDGQSQFGDGYVMNSDGIRANANAFTAGLPLNNSNDLNGSMDELRIYNSALSEADVAEVFAYSPQWNSGTTALNAGRDVTLNADIFASDAGNALSVSAGENFINNAGADALNTTNPAARWLIYSADPSTDTLGGLSADFKRYNRTFAGNAPGTITETDDGLLYAVAPVLRYDIDDLTVEYGEALGALTTNYASGLIDGDTLVSIGLTGAGVLTPAYSIGDDAGSYIGALTGAQGTLTNDLGYQFAFTAGDLTVTQAALTVSVDDATRVEGESNPIFNVLYSPFKLGESIADLDTAPIASTVATPSSAAGTYAIELSGGADINYSFSYINGVLTVEQGAPSELPSTVEQISTLTKELNNNNVRPSIPPQLPNGATLSQLPDSQIVIEIESDNAFQSEGGNVDPRDDVIKLKINKELSDELNLKIEEGVL